MKNDKNTEQGIDLIARSLARNLRLNSRAAKAEARRIRNLWHDAAWRPCRCPGLELQIVWGQQKQQLQPVPTGLLKSNRKTPIRLVKHGNSVKVSCRSTVYFEFDGEGNVEQAVTAFNAALGVTQTMKMSGHATVDMSAHYTLADQVAQDGAVRARQESIMGKTGEKVN